MLIVPPLANSPGVNSSESKSISDIGHGLELAVGIDVLVSTADSDVAVADLVLDRVQVGIAVVEVTQLVSSLELQHEMNNIYIYTPTFIYINLRSVLISVQLGPPSSTESDKIKLVKKWILKIPDNWTILLAC